ncbi:phosphatidylinositol N-acetylglucosaminyltransferase subunit GPI1, putative [Plasmodium berghei]|uniref:Phosphatidylinositol N-acetylglucosaminyltransferase subunit GPI1, putative n=2 Tax=Plasmodium berghei TaxID=5821 RepID=A0A509AKS6_PLABA|nr:phosphatidylinositol N-acetylglucosaminyltransferase subunit GPI1, putative [Plasmodium berghei ANKA]CXI63262.1 phosphatidylinositol N-acetylglucosaminyltransferase subunit GPI1, putative [Plasmodium berghei]VUC56602.1 phosphatidylinositol N-acetylglucosaminyltransferase subunit GPI1, putative [Plasmodium berghei ANKA]|eukprot:XP_034422388.1 phosphatidylinositol N-acetylglucosaminyltransferase subunit GPI1, putative [Plasmodium berghei ANKA]
MNSTEEASFHNSVNIYFPENIKIPDNVSKCFLYGFSNNNTYATIYVTSKYIKQIELEKNHDQKKYWETFRILGELVFAKNYDDIEKYTNSKDKKDKINYIYSIYYKNKPIVVKINTENDKKTSALFILYNTNKYIYNYDADHVNSLISDAYKIKLVYTYYNNDDNIDINCHKKNELNINPEKSSVILNNSNLDNIKIKDVSTVNEKLCQYMHTTPYSDSKQYYENKIENKGTEKGKKKSYDLLKNNICEHLLIRDVIKLINTRYVYIEEMEKFDDKNSGNETCSKDDKNYFLKKDNEKIKKNILTQRFIHITYIWLFFMYIISVINKTIYYLLCIPYIFNENFDSKNKLTILKLIKEKCLLNSEWYKIFLQIIDNKKKKKFYKYYKYKQILLIRIFSLLLDILGGIILFYMISIQILNLGFIYDKIKIVFETSTLTSILGTLLQKPFGIKLNNNFTSFIGSVIISILDKWEFFKNLIPFKRNSIIRFFSISSLLGLSIFLSLTIDYFRFITVHWKKMEYSKIKSRHKLLY